MEEISRFWRSLTRCTCFLYSNKTVFFTKCKVIESEYTGRSYLICHLSVYKYEKVWAWCEIGVLVVLCQLNTVWTREVDILFLFYFNVKIVKKTPEFINTAEVPCDWKSSDFISSLIHFDGNRWCIWTFSHILVDLFCKFYRISIQRVGVNVKYFEMKRSLGYNPSIVDVRLCYICPISSISLLSVTLHWLAVLTDYVTRRKSRVNIFMYMLSLWHCESMLTSLPHDPWTMFVIIITEMLVQMNADINLPISVALIILSSHLRM